MTTPPQHFLSAMTRNASGTPTPQPTHVPAQQQQQQQQHPQENITPSLLQQAAAIDHIGVHSRNDLLERRTIIDKIKRYIQLAPHVVGPIAANKNLETCSLLDLNLIHENIKLAISSATSNKMGSWITEGGLHMIESLLCSSTPIKAQGFATLSKDPIFLSMVQEYMIESSFVSDYVSPQYRMFLYGAKQLYMLHYANLEKTENEEKRLAEREMNQVQVQALTRMQQLAASAVANSNQVTTQN